MNKHETQKTAKGHEIPVPNRADFMRNLTGSLCPPPHGEKNKNWNVTIAGDKEHADLHGANGAD